MKTTLRARRLYRKTTNTPLWLRVGQRPDYRFSLANERTFLAWVRTSLALIAGAIGIDQFVSNLGNVMTRNVIALFLLAASVMVSASAYRHWASTEKAMRLNLEMPHPRMFLGLSAFMAMLVVVLVPAMLWHGN